jgi:hypothetical protein
MIQKEELAGGKHEWPRDGKCEKKCEQESENRALRIFHSGLMTTRFPFFAT